tara:strand:- start:26152 stop:27078 length:927 start_codon:yes stop_codon:yes gene_type:complete
MNYLILTTALWAFSFSLIGVYLAGQVDPWFCIAMRIALSSCLFIPFLIKHKTKYKLLTHQKLQLMLIGSIQLSMMYFFLYQSFQFLSVPEVVLFTVFTPIYISLIDNLYDKKFSRLYFMTAGIAVIGAYIIRYTQPQSNFLLGFFIVQGSNVTFALGQVAYKRLVAAQLRHIPQSYIFGWFYLGAFALSLVSLLCFGNFDKLPQTTTHWVVLTYLGLVASGLGFFMWNKGATLVKVGQLSIMNNALVPAGVLVNLFLWGKNTDYLQLFYGTIIILFSLFVNYYWVEPRVTSKNKDDSQYRNTQLSTPS